MTMSNENLLKFQSSLLAASKPKSEVAEIDHREDSEEESEKCFKPSDSTNIVPK